MSDVRTPAPTTGKLLEQRIHRLLELRTDTPVMLESLMAISQAIEARDAAQEESQDATALNTDAIRKSLRSAVEWHSLDIAENFVRELEPLERTFHELLSTVDQLQSSIATATKRIAAAETSTATFSNQASSLLTKREELKSELANVTSFLNQYEIPAECAAVLSESPDARSDDSFFEALVRAARCRQQSVELISGPHHAVGLELMESASRTLTTGLDSLFSWLQEKCRNSQHFAQLLTSTDSDILSPTASKHAAMAKKLHLGLQILRLARPNLFRACQDTTANTMKATLLRRFLRALTGTGAAAPGDNQDDYRRPLDSSAHDPLRYVGDMCAWVHYNMAEQSEVFAGFFFRECQEAASFVLSEAPAASDILPLPEMVGIACEGLARPLLVRIEQVVGSQASPVIAFKLLDTVGFYTSKLTQLVPDDSALSQSLHKCVKSASNKLEVLVDAYAKKLKANVQVFPADLSATAFMVDVTSELDQLCRASSSMLSTEESIRTDLTTHFTAAMEAIVNALLENCRASAEGLRLTETAMFMLNNLSVLSTSLSDRVESGHWNGRLQAEMRTWEESLVEQTSNDFLTSCGLLQKLILLKTPVESGKLADKPGVKSEEMSATAQAFYTLLASSTLVSLFDKINVPSLRQALRARTLSVLSEAYRSVFEAIHSANNSYSDAAKHAFSKTPAQVELLLGLT